MGSERYVTMHETHLNADSEFLARLERVYGGAVTLTLKCQYKGVQKQVLSFYCRKCGTRFLARADHLEKEDAKHDCKQRKQRQLTCDKVCDSVTLNTNKKGERRLY